MRALNYCGVCGTPREPSAPCRPCANQRNREYKLRHAEKVKAARSVYKKRKWIEGADARAAARALLDATPRARRHWAASPEARKVKRRQTVSKWKRVHRDKVNQDSANRWATIMRATPSWNEPFIHDEARRLARLRTQVTGIKWSVDHEVPLRSDTVCGLHSQDNIQVVPLQHNVRKNNKRWRDMPGDIVVPHACPWTV